MFPHATQQPLKRTRLRRKLGKTYYIWKRRLTWGQESSEYARKRLDHTLPHLHTSHQSLLLRPLKNVDMQLQHNKITNLRLAIDRLDGLVIEPGQVFSFWFLVGRPTRRKGYQPGLVLHQGQVEQGVGGGLCQLGNLLCWMALHTPLHVRERYRHGFDVFPDVNRKVPFGSGATLSYNYIDFQLENKTEQLFQLKLWLDDTHLQGEIRSNESLKASYRVEERAHRIVHQTWGGYTRHNQIWRVIEKEDQISDELVFTNHAVMMYNPLLEATSSINKPDE